METNILDEIYRKIQMCLMMKDLKCRELRFLSSRATEESTNHIDDVCQSVTDIFRTYNISVGQNILISNMKSVQLYKYLILNTAFKSQERLSEDMLNGHLVDMCPPLSPYLFIQILWNLKYEKILVESFLYLPFDLCIEILEIVRKCLEELPFERSIEILFPLITNVYSKFILLKDTGSQSANLAESIQNLCANFQELVGLLANPKITHLEELTGLKKYERHGVILKRLINVIKNCLEYKTNDEKRVPVSLENDKLYKVTFGREPFVKCEDALMKESMTSLNQELLNLLLTKIKEIDCNIYMGWAELDDQENCMISLQRSIGNDFYYFLEFMKTEEELSQATHLIECLQQLSSKPNSNQSGFILSLQELCHAITDGKKEHMKELMTRYKQWDCTILKFIYNHKSMLDNEDCLNLLKYLTFILAQADQEDLKKLSYTLIMKIMLLQSIPDMYQIILDYVTKYDGKNYLEFQHTEETFHDFITRNSNLRTLKNVRIILLFLLKNPKKVLTVLLKITIGRPEYENIMVSASDLLLLSPFMRIKEENKQMLFTNILRNICIENVEWKAKKFADLVPVFLGSALVHEDDLMNNIFIPYLESDTFNFSNINSILNNIRKLQDGCTKNTNVKGLIIALAKRMSSLRKDKSILKNLSSEIFAHMTRILEYFLNIKSGRISLKVKKDISDSIETTIEPVDKLYFAPLWYFTQKDIKVIDVIQDYERRCFAVLNRLKQDPRTSENLRNYLLSLNIRADDFLRHLIIRSTQSEYLQFGSEVTIMYWFIFGWNDEIDAHDNFLRLTMEACCLSLEYTLDEPTDLFVFLLQCFSRFNKSFVRLEGIRRPEEMYRLIVANISSLDGSIKHSPFANLFTAFIARLNNVSRQDSIRLLQNLSNIFDEFIEQCFELDHGGSAEAVFADVHRSPKIVNFHLTHEIISICMKAPGAEAYECIRRLNVLFSTN